MPFQLMSGAGINGALLPKLRCTTLSTWSRWPGMPTEGLSFSRSTFRAGLGGIGRMLLKGAETSFLDDLPSMKPLGRG